MREQLATLIGVTLYQIMFFRSGLDKVRNFGAKVDTLIGKLQDRLGLSLPAFVPNAGMAGVVALETIGSLYLVLYAVYLAVSDSPPSKTWQNVTRGVLTLMILFVVVATFLYHANDKRVIPLLSNVTTTGGFFLMWSAFEFCAAK